MQLVRSFHMSNLMNFYKHVPKISLQEVSNCQAISSKTRGLLFTLMLQVNTTHSGHSQAFPRHFNDISPRASTPSLRPLVTPPQHPRMPLLHAEPQMNTQNSFSHTGCNLRYLCSQIQTERTKQAFSDHSKQRDSDKKERMEFPKQKMYLELCCALCL